MQQFAIILNMWGRKTRTSKTRARAWLYFVAFSALFSRSSARRNEMKGGFLWAEQAMKTLVRAGSFQEQNRFMLDCARSLWR